MPTCWHGCDRVKPGFLTAAPFLIISQSTIVIFRICWAGRSSFSLKSRPPWQLDNKALTCWWSNRAVFDLWLRSSALDLVKDRRSHRRSRSGLNRSQTKAWFLWTRVSLGPLLLHARCRLPASYSFSFFFCVCLHEITFMTLMCWVNHSLCLCVSFFPHRAPGLSKGCCGFRVLDVSITNCGEQMLVQSMEEGLGPEKSQTWALSSQLCNETCLGTAPLTLLMIWTSCACHFLLDKLLCLHRVTASNYASEREKACVEGIREAAGFCMMGKVDSRCFLLKFSS